MARLKSKLSDYDVKKSVSRLTLKILSNIVEHRGIVRRECWSCLGFTRCLYVYGEHFH